MMKRRESITLVGGACAAWPVAARGHLATRIGVLLGSVANASTGQDNLSIFVQGLRKLGWVNGENLQIEARYSAGDRSLVEAYASDLVTLLKPDVLFAPTTANRVALRRRPAPFRSYSRASPIRSRRDRRHRSDG
jgi:putative ABC transport system substrate-binding protein